MEFSEPDPGQGRWTGVLADDAARRSQELRALKARVPALCSAPPVSMATRAPLHGLPRDAFSDLRAARAPRSKRTRT